MNALPPIEFFYGQTPMQKFLRNLKPFVPKAPRLTEISSVSSYDMFVSPNFMKAWEEAIMKIYNKIPHHNFYNSDTEANLWKADPVTGEITITPIKLRK